MTGTSSNPNLDALLEHGGWVRALARSLVADGAAAEDLEQKAWLAAIEKSGQVRNPKSWLGGVVRNLAGMHWREQKARRRREEVVGERRWMKESQDAASEQPDGLTERMETFRILAVALGSLQEPYGTALYLRFFEELTMREIAQRMSVPESTTKARISRGLEILRSQLESSLGSDWRAQCLVFTIPLAQAPAAAITTVLVMTLKTKLIIVAASITAASLVYWKPWDPSGVPIGVAEGRALISREEPAAPVAEVAVDGLENPRVIRSEFEHGSGTAAVPGRASTFRVTLVEEDSGKPLSGIGILVQGGFGLEAKRQTFPKGVSDEHGQWSVASSPGRYPLTTNVIFQDDEYVFQVSEEYEFTAGEVVDCQIQVPKQYSFKFKILSPDGVPIAGRAIQTSASSRANGFKFRSSTITNSKGEVTVPFITGQLYVDTVEPKDGTYPVTAWLQLTEENDGQSQTLTLFPLRDLKVMVQDENRQPIENAAISFQFGNTRTGHVSIAPTRLGPRGGFLTEPSGEVVVPAPIDSGVRVFVKHELYELTSSAISEYQTEVTFTLKQGRKLSGRIMDSRGRAIAGAEVMAWAESSPYGVDEWRGIRSPTINSPVGPDAWKKSKTNDQGVFHIQGMESQGPVFFLAQATGFAHYGQMWKAYPSEFVEVVLEPAAKLFGKVVDAEGVGIQNQWVEVQSEAFYGSGADWQTLSYYADTYRQATGEDGSFQFPGLSAGDYNLKVHGKPETYLKVATGPDPVTITRGRLDPGFMVVDFEVVDGEKEEPLVTASIWLYDVKPNGEVKGVGGMQVDANGHHRTKPFRLQTGYFMVSNEGYVPRAVWVHEFEEGISERKVILDKSANRTIRFAAADGLELAGDRANAYISGALVLDVGFLLGADREKFIPIPSRGVGGFARNANGVALRFRNAPKANATLRIEACFERDNRGRAIQPGPTIDLHVPAGTEDVTLTLTMAQLRQLGLRD